jgi:hypothetical protein
VVSIQLLPIKEIGSMLYANSLQEELCSASWDAEKEKDTDFDSNTCKSNIQNFYIAVVDLDPVEAVSRKRTSDTFLHSRLTDDVQTPPPLSA